MHASVAVIGAIALGASGCGSTTADSPRAAVAPAALAGRAPLSFKVVLPGGLPAIQAPSVAATVGEHPVVLLVDTGAASHALASWVVKAAGLAADAAAERARDIAGRSTDMRLARHPQIAITGLGATPDVPAIVVDFPPFFEAAGIGGVVSPQWLAGDGQVAILDLPAGVLSLAPASAAPAADGLATMIARARPCGNAGATFPNATFTAPATIAGSATTLSIDTGADQTRVHAGSPAGRALAAAAAPAGHEMSATAAAALDVKRVGAVALTVGELTTTVEPLLVDGASSPTCPSDGVLGMDVLRACRVIVSPAGLTAQCNRPGQPEAAAPR